jgi:hypothetical protein
LVWKRVSGYAPIALYEGQPYRIDAKRTGWKHFVATQTDFDGMPFTAIVVVHSRKKLTRVWYEESIEMYVATTKYGAYRLISADGLKWLIGYELKTRNKDDSQTSRRAAPPAGAV